MRAPTKTCTSPAAAILVIGCILLACQKPNDAQTAKSLDPARLPYKLAIIGQGPAPSPATNFEIVDLEGDGTSEMLTICRGAEMNLEAINFVTVTDISGTKARFQLNFAGPIDVGYMDTDGDGALETFISEQRENTVFLHIYNHRGELLKQFPTVIGGPRGERQWRCHVNPVGMMDANGDGRVDLVLRVYTNFAYQPRGIWVYDYLTGTLIWSHPTGAVASKITFADLDDDGQNEIISGTEAPDNGGGEMINGTDDSHTYLLILDQHGRRLVAHTMGGVFSTVYPLAHDMDHDGRPEILVLKKSRNQRPPEKSLIGFWDFAHGRMYRAKESENQLVDALRFIDFDGDGVDEFLTLWVDGLLQLRNADNEVVQSYALGEAAGGIPMVSDLNADGDPEIAICGASAAYVFSKKLRLLAKFSAISPTAQEISYGIGKGEGIFLVSADGWYRLELRRSYRAAFRLAWPLIFSFLIGGGLALAIVAGVRWWRSRNILAVVDQQYLKHSNRGIIALDLNGVICSVNERAREILGQHDVTLERTPYTEAFDGPAFAEFHSLLRKSLTGELAIGRHQLSLHLEKQQREVLLSINPMRDERGRLRGRLVILEDVTALSQSQRIIAWAAMAQQLAHEIKTPLSSVMLAVQRLQMEYQRDGVAKAEVYDRYVQYVTGEVRRLREVTDGFMKLARLEAPDLRPKDLNTVIRQCLEKLRPRICEHIQIKTDLATDLPQVNLDENQIRMALDVLLDNSLEAMEGRGQLTITTRLAQSLLFGYARDDAMYMQIEIADTGRGIPPEVREKLFEPFFTTKQGGTGLGLTIARKIIEDHRGTIEIKSEPGMGTVVFVTLPVNA